VSLALFARLYAARNLRKEMLVIQQYSDAGGGSKGLRSQYISMVTPYFKVGDFAITLTFRDTYKIDPVLRSKDVKHFIHRANIGLLGTQFRKHGQRLNCAYVFELNEYSTAVHLHMALENPSHSKLPETERYAYLQNSWQKMQCSGYVAANFYRDVYSDGWVGYMFKNITRHNADMADVDGWTLKKTK
jgi:hypothetical protein